MIAILGRGAASPATWKSSLPRRLECRRDYHYVRSLISLDNYDQCVLSYIKTFRSLRSQITALITQVYTLHYATLFPATNDDDSTASQLLCVTAEIDVTCILLCIFILLVIYQIIYNIRLLRGELRLKTFKKMEALKASDPLGVTGCVCVIYFFLFIILIIY